MIAWSTFLLAGDAIFTTVSQKTGARYTFRIQRAEFANGNVSYFVKYLSGPQNTSDYSYLGMLNNGHVKLTAKSHVRADSTLYRAADWTISRLLRDAEIPGAEVMHEGRCCVCGRTLTTPESIEMGIGPTCLGKLG